MKSEDEIRKQLELNQNKIFPEGEYWEGSKEGYILALKWVLE